MHTVHSSVCSFCTCVIMHMTVSMCSKMIHRILQFSVQVSAMLGFSSPSFTLTVKYGRHGWHAHCPHVPVCKDKSIPRVEDKGRFCILTSTDCRHDSDYTDCQVCFMYVIMSSVMFAMSGTSYFKQCLIDPTL